MDDKQPKSGQAIAEAVRDRMFSEDAASRGLGMRVEAVGPGFSKLSMAIRADMLNGHMTLPRRPHYHSGGLGVRFCVQQS